MEMENAAAAGSAPPDHPLESWAQGCTDLHKRAREAQRELEVIFRTLLARRRQAGGSRSPQSPVNLKLTLELPQPEAAQHSADQLYVQLQRAVDRHANRGTAMPLGRVYCHWCRSFYCDHASPPEPRSVFGGYSATGQPRWPEFVSVLLERKHPRVDTIFGGAPSLIATVQTGFELSREQLPIYGKRATICRILAQISMGYLVYPDGLSLPRTSAEQRTPLAVTLQIIEAADATLVLNVVGRLPDGAPTLQAFEESWDTRIGDALQATRRDLEEITLLKTTRKQRAGERQRHVFNAIHRLARNLERIFRQRERRTHHSEARHANRARPASSALRDALDASPQSIFRDVEQQTWVIVGPKNRVHVFNDQALHVTSVVYPGETVRARTTRGKWREPRVEERLAFQAALRRKAAGE